MNAMKTVNPVPAMPAKAEMSLMTPTARTLSASALWVAALLLAGCGGGDDGPAVPVVQVSSITSAAPLAFSKLATFTIVGSTLDTSNISVSATGCRGLALLPGGTADLRQITCTVTAAGAVQIEAKSATGESLLARSFSVPVPEVEVQTAQGRLTLELFPDKAPVTVLNFLNYVNTGFYDGTLFHRVVPGFVVQGGGYASGLVYKKPTYSPIALESANGLSNVRGALGMARSAAADSATSEFYVNLKDNPALDFANAAAPGYAVFGRIKEGLPVVDVLGAAATGPVSGLANVPLAELVLIKATQTK